MDPTGFTVGVIGLSGLVSGCIEAFDIVQAKSNYGREQTKLFTQLEIERCRLLIWAEAVGLIPQPQRSDSRFLSRRVDHLIHRVLKEIMGLLCDLNSFGCREVPPSQASGPIATQLLNLRTSLRGTTLEEPDYTSQFRTFLKKKWVIHDCEEVSALVDEIRYFITKLLPVTKEMSAPVDHANTLLSRIRAIDNAETRDLITNACSEAYPALLQLAFPGTQTKMPSSHTSSNTSAKPPPERHRSNRYLPTDRRRVPVEMMDDLRAPRAPRPRSTWR